MDVSHGPGPGFAPAAGERGAAVWTGVAVCCSGLSVLAVLLTLVALVAALVLGYGAGGQDPVVGDTRMETGLLQAAGQENLLPGGAGVRYGEQRSAAVAPEGPADRPADASNDRRDPTGDRMGDRTGGQDRGDGRRNVR